MKSDKKKSYYFWYAIPAGVVLAVLFFMRGIPFEDDIYILYRYAENWASGHGPVFNIGEHVEGVSTFLWEAIVTLGVYFSLDPVKFTPLLNLIVGLMCLFLISHLSSYIQFSRPRFMAFFLPLLCALSYGFYYYVASGMDAIIFSLILMICILSLYKIFISGKYFHAIIPLILMNLVRAEGFIYSVVLIFMLLLFTFINDKKISRQLFLTTLIFTVITFMLFVLRYSFYHEWMPATVMAKGYGTHLLKTAILSGDLTALKEFLIVIRSGIKYEFFLVALGAWIPFILLLFKANRGNFLLWLIAISIGMNVFVTVLAGGDYFFYKRHFIAVLPLMIIFFGWAVDLLFQKYWDGSIFRKSFLAVSLALLLLSWSVFLINPAIFLKDYKSEEGRSLFLRQLGEAMRDIPERTVLLSQMLGKISYHAGTNVYSRDILGLTDIHNAKYGDEWGFNDDGRGPCGRTDFDYSFSTPFDVFFYNSKNMHKRFSSFCNENPSNCEKYRFFIKDEWINSASFVIANINHPVSKVLEDKFGAVAISIDDSLKYVLEAN